MKQNEKKIHHYRVVWGCQWLTWRWRGSPCVPATTNNTLGLCNVTPLLCADCWVQYDTESPLLAMDLISAAKSFACPSYAHLTAFFFF